jgi:hypothetical protein
MVATGSYARIGGKSTLRRRSRGDFAGTAQPLVHLKTAGLARAKAPTR